MYRESSCGRRVLGEEGGEESDEEAESEPEDDGCE
jgi:hypothetical protein